jgi:hypothetical protein
VESVNGADLRGMGAGFDRGRNVICGNLRNLRTLCKRWYKWSADYADYAEGGCVESADGADLRGMGAGLDNGQREICVICGPIVHAGCVESAGSGMINLRIVEG